MRDRNAIKRKRQQQVRRQLIMIGIVVVLVIVMIASCSIKKSEKKKQEAKVAQKTEQSAENKKKDTKKKETKPETAEERVERVRKEAKEKGYPQAVIDLLDKNPETVEFVENYEKKKDEPYAETVGDDLVKGELPFILQWDERWGYAKYGKGLIATAGCGPTSMSMIISGLTGDATVTPEVLAKFSEENNLLDEDNNTYWSFMEKSAENWGITCKETESTEENVKSAVKEGNPIICSVKPGDFTQTGHFIIIHGYEDGKINIYDSFSLINTEKTWVFKDIKDQIKCMWVFSYEK